MSTTTHLGAIGVDFGSLRSVIAAAKKGGVDILANEASNRQTVNIIGYGEKQRKLGEQGQQQAKSNFKNTVQFASRFLGLSKNYPKLNEETKWLTSKIITNQNDKLCFDVTLRGEQLIMTPEQVVASMLTKIRQIIRNNELEDKELVLSVPSYLTESERVCLLESAKIADLKIIKLFNECSAISLSYGLFRRNELGDQTNPRHVIFVDFGHSKFSAFCASFTKEKAKIISQIHDRHLGCRDFDWTMFNIYAEHFKKQTGLDINESKKGVLRLLDGIEKQRKVLSANSDATCSVEYLMEDHDFSFKLKREEYEKLMEGNFKRMTDLLEELKKDMILKKIDLNTVTVEIIGGGSRIPAFQRTLTEFYGKEPHRTLDASACIARGCAMMAAMRSPLFKVAHYDLEESNYYPVRATWQFFEGASMEIEGEKKSSIMFPYGCVLPSTQSINVTQNDGLQIHLDYECPPDGFEKHIQTIIVPPTKPKDPEFSVQIQIQLDHNNILHLEDAELIEEYTVEEKVPIKKEPKKDAPADASSPAPATDGAGKVPVEGAPPADTQMEEEQFEIVKKKQNRHSHVKCDVSEFHRFNEKQLQTLTAFEANMVLSDRVYVETIEKKNQLEASLYSWRDQMDTNLKEYFDGESVQNLTAALDSSREWLESIDGTEVSQSQYVEKLEAIQQVTDVVTYREQQYSELPGALKYISDTVQNFQKFVVSKEPIYEHITQEEREKVAAKASEVQNWVISMDNTLKHANHSQNPPINVDDARKQYNELCDFCKPIMGQPKPAPPPKEAPAPEANKTNPAESPQPEDANKPSQEKMDVE